MSAKWTQLLITLQNTAHHSDVVFATDIRVSQLGSCNSEDATQASLEKEQPFPVIAQGRFV